MDGVENLLGEVGLYWDSPQLEGIEFSTTLVHLLGAKIWLSLQRQNQYGKEGMEFPGETRIEILQRKHQPVLDLFAL